MITAQEGSLSVWLEERLCRSTTQRGGPVCSTTLQRGRLTLVIRLRAK